MAKPFIQNLAAWLLLVIGIVFMSSGHALTIQNTTLSTTTNITSLSGSNETNINLTEPRQLIFPLAGSRYQIILRGDSTVGPAARTLSRNTFRQLLDNFEHDIMEARLMPGGRQIAPWAIETELPDALINFEVVAGPRVITCNELLSTLDIWRAFVAWYGDRIPFVAASIVPAGVFHIIANMTLSPIPVVNNMTTS